jgi:hypothetical protein
VSALGALLIGVFGALVGAAVGDLASEEIRGRLDRLPHGVVRLAARLLPEQVRDDLRDEWAAELHEILRGAEALPVTRVARGVRYALGLLRAGRSIGRELSRVHEQAEHGTNPAFVLAADPAKDLTKHLLAAASRGDQAAWGVLVDRYARLVWSIARSFRLSDEDCADVCQSTWLAVIKDLDKVTDPERFAGLLATLTRREAIRLLHPLGGEVPTLAPPPQR